MIQANAAVAGAAMPVLNRTLINQYLSRKSNLLERLIHAYFEEAPQYFQHLRRAAEEIDLGAVRQYAHALKSCSGNLGAQRLAAICQKVETAAHAEDTASVAAHMLHAGREFCDAEQALQAELANFSMASSKV